MRRITRNVLLALGVVLVLLLALGALPSLLRAGDPYYLVATPTDGDYSVGNGTAVNSSALSSQRYPYTAGALANVSGADAGRSEPYWRGPVGLKGAFSHSPFDEREALAQQFPAATVEDAVIVRHNGTFYRLAITQSV